MLIKLVPKTHFPCRVLTKIIDSTTGCDLLSFLDAYSGYHQIFMEEEDEEKTAFITPCGTYCFVRVPFGLKNAGVSISCIYEIWQMDVKTSFLTSFRKERLYAIQSEKFCRS